MPAVAKGSHTKVLNVFGSQGMQPCRYTEWLSGKFSQLLHVWSLTQFICDTDDHCASKYSRQVKYSILGLGKGPVQKVKEANRRQGGRKADHL
jgi:hypothetical protein